MPSLESGGLKMRSTRRPEVDVILPVFNEDRELVKNIVTKIREVMEGVAETRILVVNDGSKEEYNIDSLAEGNGIIYLKHPANRGYGAALKTGIAFGNAPWIAILDADGTYPVESLAVLIREMEDADMVVGARTGGLFQGCVIRRVTKKLLNVVASYLARVRIADLNSGMRIFTRRLCHTFWGLLPPRFSFTSTLTMGALVVGARVKEIPIEYHKRIGESSIRPLHDTMGFIGIIVRMGLLFHPLRLFGPVAGLLFAVGFFKGFVRDYFVVGHVGNLAVMLILTAVQIFFMGLVAELIVSNRKLSLERKGDE